MAEKDMIVNFVPGEECRIAIVEDGKLEEFYSERSSADLHVGNIYRGRVTNIEPSIQAAFVDFGIDRNGFLHISDLHPRYFPGESHETTERVGMKTPRRERPPIQEALRRGQEILVQVLKEGIGSKGPTLTSYLSIPGRFIVMMPQMAKQGVSRKIEDEETRRELRQTLAELDPPDNFGFIIRTAGIGRTKTELKRDLAYLLRLYKTIEERMKHGSGPRELYAESDLIIRTLRDVLTNDVNRIIIDNRAAAQRAHDFLRIAMPRATMQVIHYDQTTPVFDAFGIEEQVKLIHARQVPLPSGGSLVIDQAEALVAIDVNSGKFRENSDAESTAYRTNLEAIEEIARQLRLRDVGGLVVLDLIDMFQFKHRREIERLFREYLKKDRAKTKTLRISELGMMEMTRQRMRPSLKKALFNECPSCHGHGIISSGETAALELIRRLALVLSQEKVQNVNVHLSAEVASEFVNRKRKALLMLEKTHNKHLQIIIDPNAKPATVDIHAYDDRGNKVEPDSLPRIKKPQFTEANTITSLATDDVPIPDDEEMILEQALVADDMEYQPTNRAADKPVAPSASRDQETGADGKRKRRRRGRGRDRDDRGPQAGPSSRPGQRSDRGDRATAETYSEEPHTFEPDGPEDAPDAGQAPEKSADQAARPVAPQRNNGQRNPQQQPQQQGRGNQQPQGNRPPQQGQRNPQQGQRNPQQPQQGRGNNNNNNQNRGGQPGGQGGGQPGGQGGGQGRDQRSGQPHNQPRNPAGQGGPVKPPAQGGQQPHPQGQGQAQPNPNQANQPQGEGGRRRRRRRRKRGGGGMSDQAMQGQPMAGQPHAPRDHAAQPGHDLAQPLDVQGGHSDDHGRQRIEPQEAAHQTAPAHVEAEAQTDRASRQERPTAAAPEAAATEAKPVKKTRSRSRGRGKSAADAAKADKPAAEKADGKAEAKPRRSRGGAKTRARTAKAPKAGDASPDTPAEPSFASDATEGPTV